MAQKTQQQISSEWAACICGIPVCNLPCNFNTIQDLIDSSLINPGNSEGFLLNDGNGNLSWVPLQHSEDYFFTNTASDIGGDKQMTTTSISSQFTITTASVTDTLVLQNWATNANVPDTLTIPEGLYQVNVHAAQTVGTKTAQVYAEIWEVNNIGTDIALIGTTGYSTPLTVSQADIFVTFDLANSYIMASATSRIVARIRAHVTGTGSAPTIVLYYGGVTDSHITIPATASFGGIVPPSLGGTGLDTSGSTGVAQVAAGTWSVSTALANGTTASNQSTGDNSGKVANTGYVDAQGGDQLAQAWQAMGSTIQAHCLAAPFINSNTALASGTMVIVAFYLRNPMTINGIKFWQVQKGSYTGTYGKSAICTPSGGLLTIQAISNNDNNMFQTASNGSMANEAFSSPYSASAGIYYAAMLYTASATTTTPTIAIGPAQVTSSALLDFTNNNMLTGTKTGQTQIGSTGAVGGTITLSTVTPSTVNYWVSLY